MKLNKFIVAGALASALVLTTSCVKEYQDLNQDPANVTETKPEGLMTAAINAFQPNDYLIWYYGVQYLPGWCQMRGGDYAADYTKVAENGGQGSQYIATLTYLNRLKLYLESLGNSTEVNKYLGYQAAINILTVYLGIFDTDMFGSTPYTEACHYDDLGILTPKFDTVESLYDTWIGELNECITMLRGADLDKNARQDAVYGCDWVKWATLANSLKIKIAVRLLAQNKSKAMSIVTEAVNNPAGFILNTEDSFLFCKATGVSSGNSDYEYGTGNGLTTVTASSDVLNFMLASKDPRVRFIYTKNGFNSKVVQSFMDNKKYYALPSQVKANLEYKVTETNDTVFVKWTGMGEPWVRYTSIPNTYNAKGEYDAGRLPAEIYFEYFNPGLRYQIKMGDQTRSYTIASYYNNEMRKGRDGYQIPTAMTKEPDGSIDMHVIQDTDPHPLWCMYMGAGEVNLYLAEFAMLNNGTIGKYNAKDCYLAGVRASVEDFDKLANKNQIPYYGTTYGYDDKERSIELQAGEIDAMLATDNVKFEGTDEEKLEKIYLQLMMHFSEQPDDQYITARRTGYPKVDSKLIPWREFVDATAVPRRYVINTPTDDDQMKAQKEAAYAEQGYKTFGTTSGEVYTKNAPLNTERVWQDKGAPQWGTGGSRN